MWQDFSLYYCYAKTPDCIGGSTKYGVRIDRLAQQFPLYAVNIDNVTILPCGIRGQAHP